MTRQKIEIPPPPTAFGEPRAKQSQDDKPLPQQEPVRTVSVDHGLWSHPSLHSRSGMEISQARPLLTRLFSAQLIPARPFGLGWRFDEAPSGSANGLVRISRQKIRTNPRDGGTRNTQSDGMQTRMTATT